MSGKQDDTDATASPAFRQGEARGETARGWEREERRWLPRESHRRGRSLTWYADVAAPKRNSGGNSLRSTPRAAGSASASAAATTITASAVATAIFYIARALAAAATSSAISPPRRRRVLASASDARAPPRPRSLPRLQMLVARRLYRSYRSGETPASCGPGTFSRAGARDDPFVRVRATTKCVVREARAGPPAGPGRLPMIHPTRQRPAGRHACRRPPPALARRT